MRKLMMLASAAVFFVVTSLAAADAGINVNIGIPQPVVITQAPEIYLCAELGLLCSGRCTLRHSINIKQTTTCTGECLVQGALLQRSVG